MASVSRTNYNASKWITSAVINLVWSMLDLVIKGWALPTAEAVAVTCRSLIINPTRWLTSTALKTASIRSHQPRHRSVNRIWLRPSFTTCSRSRSKATFFRVTPVTTKASHHRILTGAGSPVLPSPILALSEARDSQEVSMTLTRDPTLVMECDRSHPRQPI